MRSNKVVVVGAGVSGLTTAFLLSEKGYHVTIVSKHLPGDLDLYYTSPWAGACWTSYTTDKSQQEVEMVSYRKFLSLARNEPSASILETPSVFGVPKEALSSSHDLLKAPWFADKVEGFRWLSEAEKDKMGLGFGYEFTGVTVSTISYLHWLLGKCIDNGAGVKRRSLKSIQEAEDLHFSGEKAIVVNCAGHFAIELANLKDPSYFPIRGQTIVVENCSPTQMVIEPADPNRPDEFFMCFPRREGGCVIGGIYDAHGTEQSVDEELNERIKRNAKKFAPAMFDPAYGNPPELRVVRNQVGLRPGSTEGVKVFKQGTFVHYYGAANVGYILSYGCAEKAVKLVDQISNRAAL